MGWAEFLFEFNFVISYQNSKKNNKADALTRKPNKWPTDDEDEQHKHSICMLLPPSHIASAEMQLIEENKEGEKNHVDRTNSDTNSNASDKTSPLPEPVMESNQKNELCNKICLYLANPKGLEKPEVYLKSLKVENRLLMKGN